MTDIWNLSTLCRCCHLDGCFKSLKQAYRTIDGVEIYGNILQDTLGIKILEPQIDASYTICDSCIRRLKDAFDFKEQVLACENKFRIYCKNESFLSCNVVVEDLKTELKSDDDCMDNDDHQGDTSLPGDDKNDITMTIKKEIQIELNLNQPIEDTKNDLQLNNKIVKTEPETETLERKSTELQSTAEFSVPISGLPVSKPRLSKTKAKSKTTRKKITKQKIIDKRKPKKRILQTKNKTTKKKMTKPKVVPKRKPEERILQEELFKLLRAHFIEVNTHEGTTYSCKSCQGSYLSKKDILDHVRIQHRGSFECYICAKTFCRIYMLKHHIGVYHALPIHQCIFCEKKFKSRNTLKQHESAHNNTNTYQCYICNKKLLCRTTLRKHIIHLHSGIQFYCDHCGWSFNQKVNLESHIRTRHLKQRKYPCDVCGKLFTAKCYVKRHTKIHFKQRKSFQCEICQKLFNYERSYKIHKLSHKSVYNCKRCKIAFDSKIDHEKHMETQCPKGIPKFRSYICHLCGKVLLTQDTLHRHLRRHAGIKLFPCEFCEREFVERSCLEKHCKRKHDPRVERIQCVLCKRSVIDIEKHMAMHRGETKRYPCDMCDKSYTENNLLNRHKQQKHYGVTYDCVLCGKKYVKKNSLTKHNFTKHGDHLG